MKTKAELIERWGRILKNTIEDIPELYELYNDPKRNYKGDFNGSLHDSYSLLAALDYLLNNNVIGFKENLRKAVPFKMELIKRYDNGELIDSSLVCMARFKELFDALASGDMDLAQTYAQLIGGRPEIDEEHDSEFVLSFGYSLKYAAENNLSELKTWLVRFKACVEPPEHGIREFIGYLLVLEAFLERDVQKANAAFKVLVTNHKKMCKSKKSMEHGPYFYGTENEDLFVWGIGLVNLCRYNGLDIQVSDPLIPEGLLIPVKAQ